jgi:anti-sigma B factor antagonist
MTIDAEREQDKLTLRVKGRLETSTAPQLEKELGDKLKGLRVLVLDFTSLEYITSAGLRVLLAAHKDMQKQDGTMVVQGANKEIKDVFFITGFSEFLNIE